MDMDWIVEPYIPIGDLIKYSSGLIVNNEEEFDVFRRIDNNGTANMILTLTIKPFNVINGTNITCEIDESLLLLSPLYLAGIHIYIYGTNITCKVDDSFLFATLFLAGIGGMCAVS